MASREQPSDWRPAMTFKTDLGDLEVIGNYIEGVFWIIVGIVLVISGRRANPGFKKLSLIASVLFVFFGKSDFIEAQTGAWWRPLWLLAWKGACLIALACCYWKYRQIRAAIATTGHKS
jgi:hypothetical protein